MTATTAITGLAASLAAGAIVGVAGAWFLHRRTAVSPRCLYLAGAAGPVGLFAALVLGSRVLLLVAAFGAAGGVAGSVLGRRWRLSALGAGGEMREFEQARTGLLRARRRAPVGPTTPVKTYIASQGELIRERGWPATEPFVPMTADGGGRLPRRAGRHLLIAGATGSGKTVSARRWLLARILADGVGVLVTDPKGDSGLEADLRAGAQLAQRSFVLFDPRDPRTDRWNPLWSEDTGAVVSRLVAPLQSAEGNARYYADLLQIHLGVVAEALRASGLWPASLPLLLQASQLHAYDQLLGLVREAGQAHADLIVRMREHRQVITDATGRRDLLGGTTRLRVVAGETWRTTLSPDPQRGAVCLPDALRSGAVVLLRTWVDDLPEEAKAITSLFLADAAASALALPEGTEWAALIDEFGGVLTSGAGERALALMERARSAGGQVALERAERQRLRRRDGEHGAARRAGGQLQCRGLPSPVLARITRLARSHDRHEGGLAAHRPHRRWRQLHRGIRQPSTRPGVPHPARRLSDARYWRGRHLDHAGARTCPRSCRPGDAARPAT